MKYNRDKRGYKKSKNYNTRINNDNNLYKPVCIHGNWYKFNLPPTVEKFYI